MDELYQAIEEKIKAAGYPREISGQAVYEDICDQIEGKENGSYVLLSKFEDDVIFEYHITIMDHEFNLGILTMRLPEGVYAANFDEDENYPMTSRCRTCSFYVIGKITRGIYMWILYAVGSSFFAGITSILAKCGIQKTDSDVATAVRTIVVLLFSWLMVFVTGTMSGIKDISGMTLLFLVLSGLATGASWLCYFHALQKGDINKVVPIDKSSTILTILLALIFLHEGLSWAKAGCVCLIGIGTMMMITRKEETENNESRDGSWLIYAVLSAVFASLTAILGKIGISGIDSNLGTAIRTTVVLVMAWLMVFMKGKQHEVREIEKKELLFIGLSGIATGASWLFYYRALQEGPASVVVPIDKLSILVTIAFSWIVFHEKLTRKSATGVVLITAGTVLMTMI